MKRGVRLIAFIIVLMATAANVVAAQIKTTLTGLVLSTVGDSVTTVHCVFSPYTPVFRIDPVKPSNTFVVTFRDTAKATFATPAPNGLLRELSAQTSPEGTIIHIRLATASSIRIVRDNQDLNLEFTAQATTGLPVPPNVGAPSLGSSAFRVVHLKYADVSEIAGVLGPESAVVAPADTFSPTTVFGTPQGGAMQGTSSTIPTIQAPSGISLNGQGEGHAPYGQRIDAALSIDRRLNAIMLFGSDADVDKMAAMINALDVPSKSVTLEAEIVELSESAAENVGISISNGTSAASGTFTAQTFASPQATLTLQAQIFAQIQSGNGRLLATPRIQTTSGTAASILTGDALPLLTSLTIPGSPPVIQQQIQYVNVGVHLQILPRVSLDGDVTSSIVAEVSSVTGFIQGNIPQVSQRQAVATATVHDGESYVIGGLMQDNGLRNLSKIPILGDLPFIGRIFRTTENTHQRTNLYIIVTPHVSP